MKWLRRMPFFIRLAHWEYWNSRVVYAPLYPYWLWLSLKARSFYFLTSANPNIRNGGFIMESKMSVYRQMPDALYPATVLLEAGSGEEVIGKAIRNASLQFPVIAKPDYGERGLAVKKIMDLPSLTQYAARMPSPFLVQAFVPYELEAGFFFVRLPGEARGRITGIVNKQPVAITGDGLHTVRELVFAEPRYILQWSYIRKEHATRLSDILPTGERLVLVPYGNHSRGSLFTDEIHRLNTALETTLLNICNSIPQFNFGRLDIRFDSWEALEKGQHFSVIEVNGSGSEPTHIYDPAHSIFFAWREIARHWRWLYLISCHQNKAGVASLTLAAGNSEVRAFRAIERQLAAVHW